MNYYPLNSLANLSLITRVSPFVVKEIRQELRSRFLLMSLAVSTIILATVFMVETRELTTENLTNLVKSGGSMDSAYYFCCSVCLFLIATGRTSRNFIREMDAGSLDLLYLTGLRSFDIFLGKWISLGLQGLLIMIALFPFALIGYFISGADIPGMILKSIGLYLIFLILISLTLADTAQDGTRGRGGRVGFTMVIMAYLILASTRFFSSMGTLSVYELILEQVNSVAGCLQFILTIIAVVLGIRLTLHRGAAAIAPPFEKTVLLRRSETILFGGILCIISIGRGFTLLAASGLLAYFAHVGIITTVNLLTERQRKIIIDQKDKGYGRLIAIFKTDGWRGGTLIIAYLCLVTILMQVAAGLEPWRAIAIGVTIASSILVTRFYLVIIETKRDSRFWDFIWFQSIVNIVLSLFSDSKFEASSSPIVLFMHLAQPNTQLSTSITSALLVHMIIVLAVLGLAIFGPVEYRNENRTDSEEPIPAMETSQNV